MVSASRLTPIREALERYLRRLDSILRPPEAEEVSVLESLGRVLAEDVVAPADLPPFDRAVMDGYAVRAEDTFGARPDRPVRLKLVGRCLAGQEERPAIGAGECAEVATGAMMPEGADAVVRAEHAKRLGDTVEIYTPVPPGSSVDKAGRDVRAGDVVLRRGRLLRVPDVALLLALGIQAVRVFKRPRVGVLSVGDELVDPLGPEKPGRVRDVDRPMVMLALRELGAEPVDLGIAPDDVSAIRETIAEGLETCDALITTGGISVGPADLVAGAIQGLEGAEVVVHRVAMRPGRPVALCLVRGRPVICLPGPPAACYLAFLMFARPVLLRLMGVEPGLVPVWPTARAVLARRVPSRVGITDLVRARLTLRPDGRLVAEPVALRGAGMLSTLTGASGVVIVPEELDVIEEGSEVEVLLFSCPGLAEREELSVVSHEEAG